MYRALTRNIQVTVTPRFMPEQSKPYAGQFFWAYTVEIVNHGDETVSLYARHWRITDGDGREQRVDGLGVVGEQPVIPPGERFEYTSGCPLGTPAGIMVGTYEMIAQSGERFMVDIPAFSLDSPDAARTLN
jgi:ApaG protein